MWYALWGQAAIEYVSLTAREGFRAFARLMDQVYYLVTTPRGMLIAGGVVILLAVTVGRRRRM